jgi:gluconokinase
MVILVMGVAGAGKTTVGKKLAEALGFRFSDADEFHSPENLEKMRRGVSLDEEDRQPWLRAMAEAIDAWLATGADVVLACSALKERYRSILLRDPARMRVVYLKVSPEIARARVAARTDHFMPQVLVDSQFDALEEPHDGITVDASLRPDEIVTRVRAVLAA